MSKKMKNVIDKTVEELDKYKIVLTASRNEGKYGFLKDAISTKEKELGRSITSLEVHELALKFFGTEGISYATRYMSESMTYIDTDNITALMKGMKKEDKMNVVVALTDKYGYMSLVLTNREVNELRKTENVIISIECNKVEEARELFWYAHEKCKELNESLSVFRRDMLIKLGIFTDTRVQELGASVIDKELENEAPLTASEIYEMANAMFGIDGDEIASKYLK